MIPAEAVRAEFRGCDVIIWVRHFWKNTDTEFLPGIGEYAIIGLDDGECYDEVPESEWKPYLDEILALVEENSNDLRLRRKRIAEISK